jgi:leucyl aminopeptidase
VSVRVLLILRVYFISPDSPKGAPKKRYAFVGKGITFDTGGLALKPAAGMGGNEI